MNSDSSSTVVSGNGLWRRLRRAVPGDRRLLKRYLKLLIALLIVSAIMSGDAGLVILMVTLGLALPLMLAPAAVCYLLTMFPAVALWHGGAVQRAAGILLAIALTASFALVPGTLSRWQADRLEASMIRNDQNPVSATAAKTVEIARSRENYDKLFMDGEPCGYECRALLFSGRMAWVRVVMQDGHGKKASASSTLYRAGRGSECGFDESMTSAADQCVLAAADSGSVADLRIEFKSERLAAAKTGNWLLRRDTLRTVSAVERAGGAEKLVLRHTELEVQVITIPTALIPDMRGMNIDGLTLSRSSRRLDQISLSRTLEALRVKIVGVKGADPALSKPKDWRGSITPEMTSVLQSVLALPGQEPFNQEQSRVISDWLMHARQVKVWTPELLALLRRMIGDDRITSPGWFDQIFERNPAVTPELLPEVLTALERDGVSDKHSLARQAAYTFPRIDPALLQPHAQRIIALLAKGPKVRDVLLPSIGRLGIDPVPFLLPFDAGIKEAAKDDFRRVRAACLSEKQWAPGLIPALRSTLASLEPNGAAPYQVRAYRTKLLGALANLGDVDFVVAELNRLADPDDVRMSKRLEADLAEKRRGPDALCSY